MMLLTRRCSLPTRRQGWSLSSGGGVGLSANLRKPDTDYGLENSIGIGFSALGVGFVGLG
jgi:hypothetical protein